MFKKLRRSIHENLSNEQVQERLSTLERWLEEGCLTKGEVTEYTRSVHYYEGLLITRHVMLPKPVLVAPPVPPVPPKSAPKHRWVGHGNSIILSKWDSKCHACQKKIEKGVDHVTNAHFESVETGEHIGSNRWLHVDCVADFTEE